MGDKLNPSARMAMVRVMRAIEEADAVPEGGAVFVVCIVRNEDTASVMTASLPDQDRETMVRALVGAASAIEQHLTNVVRADTREARTDVPKGHA